MCRPSRLRASLTGELSAGQLNFFSKISGRADEQSSAPFVLIVTLWTGTRTGLTIFRNSISNMQHHQAECMRF